MHEHFTLDLGPHYTGHVAQIGAKSVCAVTPRISTDPIARAAMRELAQRQGINCRLCCACPAGTAQ